jgi:hypothetical protein
MTEDKGVYLFLEWRGDNPLEHAEPGRLELFIVPIGPGQYEAIFT